jgi:hypothetical protein
MPAEAVGLPPLQRLRSGAGEEDRIGSLPLQLRGPISGMGGPWLGPALAVVAAKIRAAPAASK